MQLEWTRAFPKNVRAYSPLSLHATKLYRKPGTFLFSRCPFAKSRASFAPCFLAWLPVIYTVKLAAAVRRTSTHFRSKRELRHELQDIPVALAAVVDFIYHGVDERDP